MKVTKALKSILVFTGCCCFFLQTSAQGQWEVDMLRSINPQDPSSSTWRGISGSAKPVGIGIPLGMVAIGLLNKNVKLKENGIEALGSVAIASLSTQIMKAAFNRPRPYKTYTDIYPDNPDNSKAFPSGHVSLVFATATSLSLQYKKWYIVVPLYAWSAGVSYSRMYLGQHYPSDILAGAVVGAGSAYLSYVLAKKIFAKPKHTR